MSARTIVQQGSLLLEGEQVSFELVRVARRRNVHVLVDDDGRLSVRAPWRFSIDLALEAIEEHRNWVTRSLRKAAASRRRRPALVTGSELSLMDERLTLDVRVNAQLALLPESDPDRPEFERARKIVKRKSGSVYRLGRRLRVELRSLKPGALRELLEAWFRQQAAETLPRRLRSLARPLGVEPAGVQIRAQKSRWGSCSSKGDISLNWRLVLLPSELVDYVLVHELCHLRHMNHSTDFWSLVGSLIPDYQRRRESIVRMQPRLAL